MEWSRSANSRGLCPRRVSFVIATVCLLSCAGENPATRLPEFVRRYSESMAGLTPALKKVYELTEGHDVWQIRGDARKPPSPQDAALLVARLESLNASLAAAIAGIQPYVSSDELSVREPAKAARAVYDKLIRDNETGITLLRSFLEQEVAGDRKEEYGRVIHTIDDGIATLNYSLIHVSYMIHDAVLKAYPRDNPAKAYPEKDRDDALRSLKTIFGEERTPTLLEGYHFQNNAIPIYEVLVLQTQ